MRRYLIAIAILLPVAAANAQLQERTIQGRQHKVQNRSLREAPGPPPEAEARPHPRPGNEYQYRPGSRYLRFLENSVHEGTRWSVFEADRGWERETTQAADGIRRGDGRAKAERNSSN